MRTSTIIGRFCSLLKLEELKVSYHQCCHKYRHRRNPMRAESWKKYHSGFCLRSNLGYSMLLRETLTRRHFVAETLQPALKRNATDSCWMMLLVVLFLYLYVSNVNLTKGGCGESLQVHWYQCVVRDCYASITSTQQWVEMSTDFCYRINPHPVV